MILANINVQLQDRAQNHKFKNGDEVTLVSIGSTIGIGTEVLSVLNIFNERGIIRAKRGVTGTAHTTTTRGFVFPNSFEIPVESPFFESSLNEKVFFNPTESVGVGSTAKGLQFEFSIPSNSVLRDNDFGGFTETGIGTGDFFLVSRSNVGNGVTALSQDLSLIHI